MVRRLRNLDSTDNPPRGDLWLLTDWRAGNQDVAAARVLIENPVSRAQGHVCPAAHLEGVAVLKQIGWIERIESHIQTRLHYHRNTLAEFVKQRAKVCGRTPSVIGV